MGIDKKLPWNERVGLLSINPDAATREDVAHIAADNMALQYQIETLRKENEQQKAEIERLRERAEKYDELIFHVETKWPNESRHETALKYIKQAETPKWSEGQALKEEHDEQR